MKNQGSRTTGPALEAMHRFILWLIPTVEKFPRSQKFLLGDRIQSTALACLERLIEAMSAAGVVLARRIRHSIIARRAASILACGLSYLELSA